MKDIALIRVVSGKNRSALRLAERAHRGVNRKGSDVPYILHPVAVADALNAAGADRDVVCAGCLHDVVEDTDVTIEQIRDEFGSHVAALVSAVTKTAEYKKVRLEQHATLIMNQLRQVGEDAIALKAADLLVNITDLVLDAEEHGVEHFNDIFGANRATRKIDHYLELSDLLVDDLHQPPGTYVRLAVALKTRTQELRDMRGQMEPDASRNSIEGV